MLEHCVFLQACLPRRDCSVPSSVDAISLSLSKPRPLSIHDWAVFSKTYNLHCIWGNERTALLCSTLRHIMSVLNKESIFGTCKTLLSDSSPVLTSTFSKMHFLAVALVYAAADSSKDSDTLFAGEIRHGSEKLTPRSRCKCLVTKHFITNLMWLCEAVVLVPQGSFLIKLTF